MSNNSLDLTASLANEIAGLANASGSQSTYQPGVRMIRVGDKMVPYSGPGLVTRDGKIMRTGVSAYGEYYASRVQAAGGKGTGALGPDGRGGGSTFYYDIEKDARALYGRPPAERNLILDKLVQTGFLDKNSRGDFSVELSAIAEWLDYSNTVGLEANFALDEILSTGAVNRSGGGQARSYRTTSSEDLVRLSKRVAQDVIGRELTDDEAARFAQTYQSQEIAYQKAMYGGGTVQEPMSLETAATSFAEQAAPQEAAAYGYLGYTNKLFQMLGVG